jgi:DNA repair protein RadA/Sms
LDWGVAAASASSRQDRPIDPELVLLGEIGLTGEVRTVMQLEARLIEARRLGFKRCIVPHSAKKAKTLLTDGIEISFAKNLTEVFEQIF